MARNTKTNVQKIKHVPMTELGEKHSMYLVRAMLDESQGGCDTNIAEGAYRAGKTVCNILAFCYLLETHPDRLHLASGSSIGNAKLNLGDCNGFGIEHYFYGRCKWTKYKDNEALLINTKDGKQKVVIFAGGGNSDSYKKIQGNGYGMWIATELPNHYIGNEPAKNFIEMALSRLGQSKKRKIFWDLNPVYTKHPIYTKYIDKFLEKAKIGEYIGGLNYEVFSIFDNNSLTKQQVEKVLNMYIVGSIEYKRNIEGRRANAEGLIFKMFADNSEPFLISIDALKLFTFERIVMGVDFGGNKSNDAFVTCGITVDKKVVVITDHRLPMIGGNTTTLEEQAVFKRYCEETLYVLRTYCNISFIEYMFYDSEERVRGTSFGNILRDMSPNTTVDKSKKKPIKDRIAFKKALMASKRWFVVNTCKDVIDSTANQVWDSREGHEDERLDNGSINIDNADAEEYCWERYMVQLT